MTDAARKIGQLTPEQLAGSSIARTAAMINDFLAQPNAAASEALRIGANLRTYSEIGAEARARYEALIRLRDARPPDPVLTSKVAANPNIIVAREVTAAVRQVGDSITEVYGAIKLQSDIAGRQEADLVAVLGELRSTREQAKDDGQTIKRFTIIIAVLTGFLVLDALGIVDWIRGLIGLG
jgi:hypothetical protein